jgi:hypothetical protein
MLFLATGILAAGESPEERRARRMVEWEQVLPPGIIRDRVFTWLNYLDPRPERAFTRFTDERIDVTIPINSAHWARTLFQGEANVYSRLPKLTHGQLVGREAPPIPSPWGGPPIRPAGEMIWVPAADLTPKARGYFETAGVDARYYLATEKYRHSLLRYQWQGQQYAFRMQESCNAVWLRVQDIRRPLQPKEGIHGMRVAAILQDVLHPDIMKQGPLLRQFGIPEKLFPGNLLTNATIDRLGSPVVWDWQSSVMVFLSDEDLCVILIKATPGRQQQFNPLSGFSEADWLRANLYAADGKTLMVEKQRGGLKK